MATMKQIYDGLAIFMKYEPDGEINIGHDEIFAGNTDGISEEDYQALEDLGWSVDDGEECWAHFV